MCSFCGKYPLILQHQIIKDERHYVNLSIRSNENKMIFNTEWFSITTADDSYWGNIPGQHICGYCLIREIIDNKIQWIPYDFTKVSITLGGNMVNIGDNLLNKVSKLKVFI